MKTIYVLALALFCGCAADCSATLSNSIVSVTLERTVCYGSCPDYILTLLADGSVTFEGRRFVKQHGGFKKRIAPGKLAPIFKKIQEIHFWELQDSYHSKRNPDGSIEMVTDFPTQYVTVKSQEKTKKVKDYYGAPNGLRELEKLIDEVAGAAEWIGREDEKKP